MQKIEFSIDKENFAVTKPKYIGDSELVNIKMSYELVELTILNHGYLDTNTNSNKNQRAYIVKVYSAKYINFISDHLQNVVENIYIFRQKNIIKLFEMVNWVNIDNLSKKFDESVIFIVFRPIVGVDMLLVGERVEFFEFDFPFE